MASSARVAADGAADHRVGLAAPDHQRARSPCCACARCCGRDRATRPCAPSGCGRAANTRESADRSSGSTSSKSSPGLMRSPSRSIRCVDHAAPPDQDRLAPGRRPPPSAPRAAPARPRPRHRPARFGSRRARIEDRLHQQAGAEHELAEAVAIGLEIVDRPRRHAALHRRLGHRRRDLPRSGADRRAAG